MRLRTLFVVALLAGCGPVEQAASDLGIPGIKPDTSAPDAEVVEPPDEYIVSILGLDGMADAPDVFCARSVKIVVEVEGPEGYNPPVIAIPPQMLSNVTATNEGKNEAGNDLWSFSFDAAFLATEEEIAEGTIIEAVPQGGTVELVVYIPGDDISVIPGVGGPVARHEYSLDTLPPTLDLGSPSTVNELPTLTGEALFEGVVEDSVHVGRVEVEFLGKVLAVIERSEEETASQSFRRAVDIRYEPTAFSELKVTAFDLCGFSAEVAVQAKVVAWPFLRKAPVMKLASGLIIEDSAVVDWNGDGYPDILFATGKGVALALNGGAEAPGEFDPETVTLITNTRADAVASLDLDGDGDLDIATVGRALGTNQLFIYRLMDNGVLLETETHELELNTATKITDILAADFTGDPIQGITPREDIVIATNSQQESILLFKRQNPDQPQEFDQCEWVEPAPVAADAGDDEDEGHWDCPELFSPGVKAGGVFDIASIVAADITGLDSPEPDGYLDLVMGIEGKNELSAYVNRFEQEGKLDTAFALAVASPVYPVQSLNAADTRYFCLGNFIEEDGAPFDSMDAVVGTEQSGTWRVIRGIGHGEFKNGPWPPGEINPIDVWSMSGTKPGKTAGLVCDDFDGDGHMDFAIATSARLLQVHLGNGKGRFNQLEGSDLLNPINEGIGFVLSEVSPQNLVSADFNQDGLADILLDYRTNGFTILRNTTDADGVFDMHATRALVTPLGKRGADVFGLVQSIAIAELNDNGPGRKELVAVTDAKSLGGVQWLTEYHPIGSAYRQFADSNKAFLATTAYVWRAGTYRNGMPSYPAAYDRFPRTIFGGEFGAVSANSMEIADIATDTGSLTVPGPDGRADIVIAGAASGTPPTSYILLGATADDFWDVSKLGDLVGGMFRPYNGAGISQGPINSFKFLKLDPTPGAMPGLVVGTDSFQNTECAPATLPPLLRYCPWLPPALGAPPGTPELPFWRCKPDCVETIGHEVGGRVQTLVKLASEGPGEGFATDDPNVRGHILTLNELNGSVTRAMWDGDAPNPGHPWLPTSDFTIGDQPKTMATGDLDGDGLVDLVATVKSQVLVAFGLEGTGGDLAFESARPVDQDPTFTHKGGPEGAVVSDVNADGYPDVLFAEAGTARLTVYLGIGEDINGGRTRVFHGPIYIPTCSQPSQVLAYDFNGDGCEAIAVLCRASGAVMLVSNDTCAEQAAQ